MVRLALPLLTPPLCTEGWFAKTQKPIFFKRKIIAEPQKVFLFSKISILRGRDSTRSLHDLRKRVFRNGTGRKNTNTDRQTDIASSRLNRPKGRFSAKFLQYYILQFECVWCLFISIFKRLGVAGAVLQTALSTELVSYSYSP